MREVKVIAPGPWASEAEGAVITDARGNIVCELVDGSGRPYGGKVMLRYIVGNAELIAQAPALHAEAERLRETVKELIGTLSGLRRAHDNCEDCWYSCPLSADGCCNDGVDKSKCNCGADTHNAKIDAALSKGRAG